MIFDNLGQVDFLSGRYIYWEQVSSPPYSSPLGTRAAMPFHTGSTPYELTSISLYLTIEDSAENLQIGLYADDSALPSTEALELFILDPEFATGTHLVQFESAAHPLLNANSTYWIVLQPHDLNLDDSTGDTHYVWHLALSETWNLPGSYWNYSTGSWDDWQSYYNAEQLTVNIQGTAAVPEPANSAILISALCAGIVFIRRRRRAEPNQALEPTTLSVTLRAPSRTDRAS